MAHKARIPTCKPHPVNLTVLNMKDDADDPYLLPTEEELAHLIEY